MERFLKLHIVFTSPPEGVPADVIASIDVFGERFGSNSTGGLLSTSLSQHERELLKWYLEEYWQWPFEGFLERGRQVEALLPQIGHRLYKAIFPSLELQAAFQAWRTQSKGQCQITIVSDVPKVLDLPWELLHDGQSFLALDADYPVPIVRRLSQNESDAFSPSFQLPLRVLLITARPVDAGFVDSRNVARELLDAMQDQIDAGHIELEFLRPPTMATLRERLEDRKRPIHVLHFDGHGTFDEKGKLAFEDDEGKCEWVIGEDVAKELQDKGVRLVVLNACQSAVSQEDNVLSSVAAQLLQGRVDTVIAMSASLLVASAVRYVESFYHALARGTPATMAQEQARKALYKDLRRHPLRRTRDQEGQPVELHDWWMPHYYEQRAITLQPMQMPPNPQQRSRSFGMGETMPDPPIYGFGGRALELLNIERLLRKKWMVVVHGFGGIGKTALAREAAEWLTRTEMYEGACYISFEGRGDAHTLLKAVRSYLSIDENHASSDVTESLTRLKSVLKRKPILLIADHLESILPNGEASLSAPLRTQLWDVLLELRNFGAGVLLVTRAIASEDERLTLSNQMIRNRVIHWELKGLSPEDAYALAMSILDKLEINRDQTPYADVRDLLAQLNHHPLAIQLVFLALQNYSLAKVRTEFAALLPEFADKTLTGRNQSLLVSLDYSLRHLNEEHRALITHLAPFEGGASEWDLMPITQIPRDKWDGLRRALEQAGLLSAEPVHPRITRRNSTTPLLFLRFHPILTPFLRSQMDAESNKRLDLLYMLFYSKRLVYVRKNDIQKPESSRAWVRIELPNLRRALGLMLELGFPEEASDMATNLIYFMEEFGLRRECEELRQRLAGAMATMAPNTDGVLTRALYLHEIEMIKAELRLGNLRSARDRCIALLAGIEAQPEGKWGRGSFAHGQTLACLARCLSEERQHKAAKQAQDKALMIVDVALKEGLYPEHLSSFTYLRLELLHGQGNVLKDQGQYQQARAVYKEFLKSAQLQGSPAMEAAALLGLGTVATELWDFAEAVSCFKIAIDLFRTLGDAANEASVWYQAGHIGLLRGLWTDAEFCFRKSLILREQLGDQVEVARICDQLAEVAQELGHLTEAEGWCKRALELDEQVQAGGAMHASHLTHLALILVEEVQAGRAPRDRLKEAQSYADQALTIKEGLDPTARKWITLQVLADIAYLEGRVDLEKDYRRREREATIAYAGNRDIMLLGLGSTINAIVEVARGNTQKQAEVEADLLKSSDILIKKKGYGTSVIAAVRRIWGGERDWHLLVEDLDGMHALMVQRVLEILAQTTDLRSQEDQTNEQDQEATTDQSLKLALSDEEQAVTAATGYLHVKQEEDVVRQYGALLQAIAAVCAGDFTYQSQIDTILLDLEKQNIRLKEPVERIRAGERNRAVLTKGLDKSATVLIHRLLEILAGK